MAERKYIDAEALNSAIREAVHKYPNTFYNGLETARKIAHDFPAADVRPVVRGTWVPNVPPRDLRPRCTVCGDLFPVRSNFCPNCGACMGG